MLESLCDLAFHLNPLGAELVPSQATWPGLQRRPDKESGAVSKTEGCAPQPAQCTASVVDAASSPGPGTKRSFKLEVNHALSGEVVCTLEADILWTVADVKKRIYDVTGIPAHEQRLTAVLDGGQSALVDTDVVSKSLNHRSKLGDVPIEMSLLRLDPLWANALREVSEDGKMLALHCEEFRQDRDIVLAAVRSQARALKYAAADLQCDTEFVLEAIQANPEAFKYAPDELRCNTQFTMAAVQRCGAVLKHVGINFKHDRAVVTAAIRSNHAALRYAAEELRADRDLVLAAVMDDTLLSPASEQESGKIEQVGQALKYVANSLCHDREFVLKLVERWGQSLKYAADELRGDASFVWEAVQCNATSLKFAADGLWMDRNFVLAAVRKQGSVLKYASEALQRDAEVVLSAIQSDPLAIKYASEDLRRGTSFSGCCRIRSVLPA
eukprot:TRINITY_DN27434_c0_g1_i1.p1 TRINITY_DN27434_c0_g1~~TRINITY_DN27434_c0_g1_i1.p1  ORF type:complete len:441 (-),score=87.77 TRINITY_DN27434_c0_g1_i1:168-1490(-)